MQRYRRCGCNSVGMCCVQIRGHCGPKVWDEVGGCGVCIYVYVWRKCVGKGVYMMCVEVESVNVCTCLNR